MRGGGIGDDVDGGVGIACCDVGDGAHQCVDVGVDELLPVDAVVTGAGDDDFNRQLHLLLFLSLRFGQVDMQRAVTDEGGGEDEEQQQNEHHVDQRREVQAHFHFLFTLEFHAPAPGV